MGRTCSKSGGGLFPRQRFDKVHVAFRIIPTALPSVIRSRSGAKMCCERTMSRHSAESPAMFPSAHTACSRTLGSSFRSSWIKMGIAPLSMTARVWVGVPLATFVRAHAASNWSLGSGTERNSTKRGMTPILMTSSIGGFFSMARSLRNSVVASRCWARSPDWRAWWRTWRRSYCGRKRPKVEAGRGGGREAETSGEREG
jgi:hypothetical protein